jgi:hypothetical protein
MEHRIRIAGLAEAAKEVVAAAEMRVLSHTLRILSVADSEAAVAEEASRILLRREEQTEGSAR